MIRWLLRLALACGRAQAHFEQAGQREPNRAERRRTRDA